MNEQELTQPHIDNDEIDLQDLFAVLLKGYIRDHRRLSASSAFWVFSESAR